jgi:uncharacterized membrane protein
MGQKQDVSPRNHRLPIRQTVHILSVSGLHIGLFYFSLAFAETDSNTNGSFIKLTLILISLLSFALIGLAPSVVAQ